MSHRGDLHQIMKNDQGIRSIYIEDRVYQYFHPHLEAIFEHAVRMRLPHEYTEICSTSFWGCGKIKDDPIHTLAEKHEQ